MTYASSPTPFGANAGATRPWRCLWLAGESPFPPDSGCLTYSLGIAASLAEAGATVHWMGLARGDGTGGTAGTAGTAGLDVEPIDARRRSKVASLASPWPNMTASFAVAPYRAAVAHASSAPGVGMPWWSTTCRWAGPSDRSAGLPATSRPPVLVFATQNHETVVRAEVARGAGRGGPARRAVFALDARKAARLERRVAAAADVVTCITDDDARSFAAVDPGVHTIVLPPGYPVPGPRTFRPTAERPRRVVVVTNLEWHVKQENLRTFLAAADPALAAAGAELQIVGPAPRAFVDAVAPDLRATTFVGRVDSIPEVIGDARIGVVSEPVGGGFKIKTLDYVFNDVPMAVLSGSVAGLPLDAQRDYLEAPDEPALARAIVAALDDTDRLDTMARHAAEICGGAFDWGDRGRRLLTTIQDVAARREPVGTATP